MKTKLTSQFRVLFDRFADGADTLCLTRKVVAITRPQEHFHMASMASSFNLLTLVLEDDTNNVAGKLISKQCDIQRSSVDSWNTFDLYIETVHDEKIIEQWACRNCHFHQVEYDNFSIARPQPLHITLIIQSDDISHEFYA